MTSIVVVDSGPLLASLNSADPDHRACLEELQQPGRRLVIPALCIAEVAYLVARKQGATVEARFLRGLEHFDVEAPKPADWARIADLIEQYQDFPLGATDASVVALAERLGTREVLTLDRRHFAAIQPRHCDRFHLLPA